MSTAPLNPDRDRLPRVVIPLGLAWSYGRPPRPIPPITGLRLDWHQPVAADGGAGGDPELVFTVEGGTPASLRLMESLAAALQDLQGAAPGTPVAVSLRLSSEDMATGSRPVR